MLNPQIISENIIYLRQRAGLTQQELAARANVTHQAVSKWENGSSIPDLQTLMTLSRLFDATLDELLTEVLSARREPEAADAAPAEARTEPTETAASEPEAAAEPPESEKTKATDKDARGDAPFNLREIVRLAPFLPNDRLRDLVLQQIDSVTLETLVPLAPFLGRRALGEIAGRMDWAGMTPTRLVALAPFLGHDALKGILGQMDSAVLTPDQLTGLAPFLGRDSLNELVQRMPPESLTADQIAGLAPFLGSNALDRLLERIGRVSMKTLTTLAPFLSRDAISAQMDRLAHGADGRPAGTGETARGSGDKDAGIRRRIALRRAEEGDFDEIEELLPALDEETLMRIVDMALDADDLDFLDGHVHRLSAEARRKIALHRAEEGDFDEIEELLPALDEETLTRIVDMALDADDLDFLDGHFQDLRRLRGIQPGAERGDGQDDPADGPRADEAGEIADTAAAIREARQGRFDAVPAFIDRMTDEQKDEIVRLAIVYDNVDFLVDLAGDLPRASLETLCFWLARMHEEERLAPFMGRLTPDMRERVAALLSQGE